MDPPELKESSTMNSPQKSQRFVLKGILKITQPIECKLPVQRSSTTRVRKTTRVTFTDKVKNIPICTVINVEPIVYEDTGSPKSDSCLCLVF